MNLFRPPIFVTLTAIMFALAYVGLMQRDMLEQVTVINIGAAAVLVSAAFAMVHSSLQRVIPENAVNQIALGILIGLTFYASNTNFLTGATGMSLAMAVFAGAYFLMDKGVTRRNFRKSLDKLTEELEKRRAENSRAQFEAQALEVRTGIIARATQRFQTFMSTDNKTVKEARARLMMAGLGSDTSVMIYIMARILLPLGTLALIAPLAFSAYDSQAKQLMVLAVAPGAVYYIIEKYVSGKGDARRKAIILEMPDVLDLLVIYTEAGKSLENALHDVIQRSERRYPTICREIRILLYELQLLSSRDTAYDRFVLRTGADLVKRFVTVVKQSEAVGTPVSGMLRTLAKESRRDRVQMAERKAARVPILIQLPIVLFILPALFVIIMAPVAIKIMEELAGTGL